MQSFPRTRLRPAVAGRRRGKQRTEDRGQRTEDRGQRTEDRGQRTEEQSVRLPFRTRLVNGEKGIGWGQLPC
jgi:hypothetical protein